MTIKLKKVVLLLMMILAFMCPSVVRADEENTYNMLLVGADRRDDSWNGNSDTMILITANYDTEQIYLTSFMRDLYADVPGHGVHKLNYAYAVGGASKLMETLESNYGVHIDNYMAVDFVLMAELVDLLGGVDLYVKENEVPEINKNASWMYEKYGTTVGAEPLQGEGYHHLDGSQTVSFCRIRYVGNNDYERTERQRRVLVALREKTNAMSLADLEMFVMQVLQMADNDVSALSTVKVLKVVRDSRSWEQIENRVPYDGMFTSQNEILVPTDMGATVAKLRGLIYGEEAVSMYDYSVTVGNDTDTIMEVQQALNDAGFDCGAVDGYLGGKTAQAIVSFQEANDLEPSGMIDEDLLGALGLAGE